MPSKVSGRRAGYVAKGPCRQCNRPQSECGRLSSRRLCADCGDENMNRAARELAAGEGPAWDEYVRAMKHYVRAIAHQ